MEKNDSLNQVAAFHEAFGHPILKTPMIPSKDRANLRVSLLQEELNELEKGIEENDIVQIADALCDIQYVLSGAILEFGLGEKFKSLFDEVQRSNMSKACRNMKEVEETIHHFKQQNVEAYFVKKNDLYFVYRKSDNKTLKNINYSPADLGSIINS
jgi:predicted HAD superfamily Cof-like phosphohydrolase